MIHDLVRERNVRGLKDLLEKGTTNINSMKYGTTPLHEAVRLSNDKSNTIISLLIEHGANINKKSTDTGETPLHLAILKGDKVKVELLLKHGANIDSRTQYNKTALHLACELVCFGEETCQKMNIVKLLLEHNAHVNVKDVNGQTPLHISASIGAFNEVKLLVLRGRAMINIRDAQGNTPFDIALEKRYMQIAAFLFDHGAHTTNKQRENIERFTKRLITAFSSVLRIEKQSDAALKNVRKNQSCPLITVTVYREKHLDPNLKSRASILLPRRHIRRQSVINEYEGQTMYPETRVNFRERLPKYVLMSLLSSRMRTCHYAKAIASCAQYPEHSFAVARIRSAVVGAFCFTTTSRYVYVNYLCSTKSCKGIGTALMYAGEEIAKRLGVSRINLNSSPYAKPFYFKVGYNYASGRNSNSNENNDTQSFSEITLNSTSSGDTKRKRKLRYPSSRGAKMRKYLQK